MVTPLQHRVYVFIESYLKEHTFSPSLTEIASGIGISPKSISLISRSIHALVESGKLSFHKKGYRNIQLANSSHQTLSLGAAGSEQQQLNLAPLLSKPDHFCWQVKCNSLAQQGIFGGDFLILKAPEQVKEGSRVLAIIDQQFPIIGRLSYFVPGRYVISPENSNIKPKAYLPQRVQVQGEYLGLLRWSEEHGQIA